MILIIGLCFDMIEQNGLTNEGIKLFLAGEHPKIYIL